MTPTWQTADGSIRLYNADCLSVCDSFPLDASIISDPPYGMANDCDYTRFTMGPNGHGKASSRCHAAVVNDDRPFDPSPWLDFPRVVLWGCNHFAARLPVGTSLVWIKRFDGGFGSFLSDAEIAWMKGGHGVYCRRDTSLFADTHNRAHPTQKPVGIMEWCIERAKAAGTIVIDPYMGSGTTALAAIASCSPFIGCEIDPVHFATAVRRIEAELNRAPLFEKPPVIQRSLVA